MKWIETTVGEYCPFVYGKSLPQRNRENGNVPVYGSNGIVDYHKTPHVKGFGIIIGRKGSVGAVHLSKSAFWPIDTSFYVEKDSIEELYFTYYLLKSLGLEHMNSDSAVPGLNRDNAHALAIRIPENSDDRKLLGSWVAKFDEKVELNTQTNQTLEQIAQAIFKSWFVDFDPVKAKIKALAAGGSVDDAELAAMRVISAKTIDELNSLKATNPEVFTKLAQTAALFPAAMQDSELGEIPKGWGIVKTEQLAEKIAMGPFGSNIKVSTFVDNGVPIISGHHLKETLLTEGNHNFITTEHANKLKNSCVHSEDIIFTHAGNIGQVSLIPENTTYYEYVISQRQFYLRVDRERASPYYLVFFFKSTYGQHVLLSNASQVGVPSIARPSSHLKNIELIKPTFELMERFENICKSLLNGVGAGRKESLELAELRDTLLPKFLSGEINLTSEVVV
ncbi:restriction endonuclease subunit S [Vibrio metschnikovii]|nr:restriction endonuclease subunit S [Vibrio metschnikovii]EKO3633991.1 restriction endonuclease subunit S [Vibrio metschnikovii]EKO3651842.1 restriction endonuclease subunit S [Vibrio metschnikovii]